VWAATANRGLAPSSCAGRRASVAERVLHGERASTGPSRATEEEIVSPNVPDPRLRWRRASTVRVCLALLFFGCAAKQEASYEVLVRVESPAGPLLVPRSPSQARWSARATRRAAWHFG